MVIGRSLVLFLFAAAAWGQTEAAPAGPTLYGDGGGRVWTWSGGKKTVLTPASLDCVLGGAGKTSLWGWSVQNGQARFFTLALPQKGAKPAAAVFEKTTYPAPDLADRVGGRLLLVYNAGTAPRWEVWQNGKKIAAEAYEDKVVLAAALGPADGWLVTGATAGGAPWLDVSGGDVIGPEGWKGRLSVAVWLSADKAPAIPFAAGWGATAASPPQVLFFEPSGWSQPAPPPASDASPEPTTPPAEKAVPALGVYPVVGAAGEKGLTLGGWQRSAEGVHPWFWDGKAAAGEVTSDGQIQALSLGKAKALVVKHQTPPWFTLEDGKTSTPLEGLDDTDRVVAVKAPAAQ